MAAKCTRGVWVQGRLVLDYIAWVCPVIDKRKLKKFRVNAVGGQNVVTGHPPPDSHLLTGSTRVVEK